MAWTGIPWLGRLRQLLRNIIPMQKERAPAMIAPSVAQPTSGQIPNIWWKAVSMEELRSHPSYIALPATPPLLQPSTYRYVRQESPLWSALHSGVLTSSTLNGALGFYEPGAVQRLGLPKHYVRHGALMAAYSNLLEPEYIPPTRSADAPPVAPHNSHSATVLNSNSSNSSSKTLAQVWLDAAATASPAAAPSPGCIPAGLGPHDRAKGVLQNSAASMHSSAQKLARRKHRKITGSKDIHSASAVSVQQEQSRRLKSCTQNAAIGIGSIRCKWGSVQEATALWELMHAVPQGSLEEVGLCRVEAAVLRERYGFAEGTLPPMGASPDGLIRQRQPPSQSSHASAALTALRAAFAGMSVQDDSSSGGVLECEVVEVKNTCPFRQQSGLTKKGKPRSSYLLRDPGPRQKISQTWVTQLQLEMLAAPAQSALLVSRSASQGMTIFRMWRDEDYLRAMLGYLSVFYTSFVLKQQPPPSNLFLNHPEYQHFLQHTLALSQGADVVLHVPPEAMPQALGDLRTFLQ